jgi:hypothetical protein
MCGRSLQTALLKPCNAVFTLGTRLTMTAAGEWTYEARVPLGWDEARSCWRWSMPSVARWWWICAVPV